MGQANSRGTYEERKAMAIVRDKELAEERKLEQERKYANMTPIERRQRTASALYLAQLQGMVGIDMASDIFSANKNNKF